MKKLILIAACALTFVSGALADSQTFSLGGNTQSNLIPQSIKINSLSVTTTNTVTLLFYDAPGSTITNNVGAYSNLVVYATNITFSYTNFFGASNGYILTNGLVTLTNSVAAHTITYPLVFTQSYPSNVTVNLPNLNALFQNGVLVTNQSANTVLITPTYSGN